MKLIKLQINTRNQKYPIFIGKNISDNLNKLLKESSINFNQCLIIVDNNVPKKQINKILNSLSSKKVITYSFVAHEKKKKSKKC